MVATAYALSVIPGFAIMAKGAMAPIGQETLFGTAVTVVSTLTVLLATLYRHDAAHLARRHVVLVTVALLTISFAALGGFALVRYLTVIDRTLIVLDPEGGKPTVHMEQVVIPLFLSDEMEAARTASGGRMLMVDEDPVAARTMTQNAPMRMAFTYLLLVLLYALSNASAVLCLAVAGWRVTASGREFQPSFGATG
jgi:hypothetical protein